MGRVEADGQHRDPLQDEISVGRDLQAPVELSSKPKSSSSCNEIEMDGSLSNQVPVGGTAQDFERADPPASLKEHAGAGCWS